MGVATDAGSEQVSFSDMSGCIPETNITEACWSGLAANPVEAVEVVTKDTGTAQLGRNVAVGWLETAESTRFFF